MAEPITRAANDQPGPGQTVCPVCRCPGRPEPRPAGTRIVHPYRVVGCFTTDTNLPTVPFPDGVVDGEVVTP